MTTPHRRKSLVLKASAVLVSTSVFFGTTHVAAADESSNSSVSSTNTGADTGSAGSSFETCIGAIATVGAIAALAGVAAPAVQPIIADLNRQAAAVFNNISRDLGIVGLGQQYNSSNGISFDFQNAFC